MFTILALNLWNVLNSFIRVLIPIAIVVVLPVLIVRLVMRARQHEVNKKAEIMMKAIENGAELSPDFFKETKRQKTVKDKLMGYLTAAMVTGFLGLITLVLQAVLYPSLGMWEDPHHQFAIIFFMSFSGILLAVGIAFLVVYFVGKKVYAKELAELKQ